MKITIEKNHFPAGLLKNYFGDDRIAAPDYAKKTGIRNIVEAPVKKNEWTDCASGKKCR